ncbi:hypothetical protein DRJ00_04045 [Candidatus Aerophobetes bacterium]|uniref:Uncharacterized protein n=1 Tax=Aerophobetes bacterium TaxID=2030807 RepID=A0A497E3X6_UNCAE|nr:MAG: hypothetical protein DRJ00_04045 [Candidatus Aerophobetes bacterium]
MKEVWTLSEKALFLLSLFRFNHIKMPKEVTDILIRKMILRTLRKTKGNIRATARRLSFLLIQYTWRKMRRRERTLRISSYT